MMSATERFAPVIRGMCVATPRCRAVPYCFFVCGFLEEVGGMRQDLQVSTFQYPER